jgi:hypothetical protein
MADSRWLPQGHQGAAGRRRSVYQRQVVVQEVGSKTPDKARVDRLATLLSEALARRLGQDQPASSVCSTPLDYPHTLLPTTGGKYAVPTKELK